MTDSRPKPVLGVFDRPFWAHVRNGELRLQRCGNGHFRFPPGPVCPRCAATDYGWELASGRGQIVTWTEFHRQYFPEMPPPYIVVCAQLEEGPLLLADFAGAESFELKVGMPVRLVFRETKFGDEDGVIYQWNLAG